jgi:hypothetical protein
VGGFVGDEDGGDGASASARAVGHGFGDAWAADIRIQYYSVVENEKELKSGSKVIIRE